MHNYANMGIRDAYMENMNPIKGTASNKLLQSRAAAARRCYRLLPYTAQSAYELAHTHTLHMHNFWKRRKGLNSIHTLACYGNTPT